jgi:hypothetical protein
MIMALTLLSIASPRTNLLVVAVMLILVPVVAMAAAVPVALPGCPEACGNITVPHPFGIGQGCFRAGFNLTCDETHHPPKLLIGHNVEVLDISLPDGTVRINSREVNASSLRQYNGSWSAGLMDDGPLSVSTKHNVFVAIGCDILASLVVNRHNTSNFASICAALCLYGSPYPGSIVNASCSGEACCQISISQASPSYGVQLKYLDKEADGTGSGAAFIVDNEWFTTNHDWMRMATLSLLTSNPREYPMVHVNETALVVPTVLEWFLDTERDDDMFIVDLEFSGLRCKSLNSTAVSAGDYQLRCDCSDGFQGNPYIINGCQGTDQAPCFNFLYKS